MHLLNQAAWIKTLVLARDASYNAFAGAKVESFDKRDWLKQELSSIVRSI